jgi:murein DD-endopeptidase MepM/ murein hydrolase activator NlpD
MKQSSALLKPKTTPTKRLYLRKSPRRRNNHSFERGFYNAEFSTGDDPVNFIDLWGLNDSDANNKKTGPSDVLAEVNNGVAFPVGMSADDYGNNLTVSSIYGDRPSFETPGGNTLPGHNGLDIPAPTGTRVNAVADGTVVTVGDQGNTGYGKYTEIEHPNGNHTLYGHQNEIYVTEGQNVEAGQNIGTVGSTGKSTGPHLHFGLDGDGDGLYEKNNSKDNPTGILFGGSL